MNIWNLEIGRSFQKKNHFICGSIYDIYLSVDPNPPVRISVASSSSVVKYF